jgi:hypothetical protein
MRAASLLLVAALAAAVAVAVAVELRGKEPKLVRATIINPLETPKVSENVQHISEVLRSEPAVAELQDEKVDEDIGKDDATLMGPDTCGPLPSELKPSCKEKREAARKKRAMQAAEDAAAAKA